MREDDLGVDIYTANLNFFDDTTRPGFTGSSGYPIRREMEKMNEALKVISNQLKTVTKRMNKMQQQINQLKKAPTRKNSNGQLSWRGE